jgi:glycosyltransferase involved in cell wall biosynthesis
MDALRHLQSSDVNLNLIGEGYYQPTIMKKMKKYKGNLKNIHLTSQWLSYQNMIAEVSLSDIVVVPSVYPEPFGLIGLDAMSLAKPVIGTRVGGIPEWLKDGSTGILVDPHNPRILAAAIDKLLADSELRILYGKNGRREILNNFNPYNFLNQIRVVYEALINRNDVPLC